MNLLGRSLQRFPQPSESEARLLSRILRRSGVTQPELVGETGLSQQTVSRLAGDLQARGLLRQGARVSTARRGQPAYGLELEPGFAYAVGLSLMTDALHVLLMDFSGQVLESRTVAMLAMTRSAVFSTARELEREFLKKHGVKTEQVFGTGVAISGYCIGRDGRRNTHRLLDDWALVDLATLFGDALDRPAWVENDGNAAAVGESLLGVGRQYADFVYILIDAGIGGGVVHEHRLLRGRHGNGGEIGMVLPQKVYAHPNLETLRQHLCRAGIELANVRELLARYDPDWPGLDEWVRSHCEALSLIVSASAALLDPDAVVIGGRIPRDLVNRLIPHLDIYDDRRRAEPRPLPLILPSQVSEDACAFGAAALAFENHFFRPCPP